MPLNFSSIWEKYFKTMWLETTQENKDYAPTH